MLLILLVVQIICIQQYGAFTIGSIKAKTDIKKYLETFGYFHRFSPKPPEEELKDSIIRLQTFAGIKRTGKVDAATIKLLNTDRCGLKDPEIRMGRRHRRFVLQGSRWIKNKLTWKLANAGASLRRNTVRKVLHQAFGIWSSVTDMEFTEISRGEPDIWVRFVRYYHNDPYPFDGSGGTLAHAFYPHNNKGLSGDVHFDDDENYTYKSKEGRNLLWVATHEIGHSLGLDHSNVRSAVMYPWYTAYKPGFSLNYDDRVAIQSLYGTKKKVTKAPVTRHLLTTRKPTIKARPPVVKPKHLCPASEISTVYYNSYARLLVTTTVDDKLYFINTNGGIHYGPTARKNYFPLHKGLITASFSMKRNNRMNTIVFTGKNYYIYQHFKYISGPHSIHERSSRNILNIQLPYWVQRLDAAMTWYRNGRTYFFYNQYYWRYDNQRKIMDRGYPRRISSAWKNIPDKVNAAYSSKNEKLTFFISGKQFYRLNDGSVSKEIGFPKSIEDSWFKCRAGQLSIGGMSVGSMSIGSMSVGGMSIGSMKSGERSNFRRPDP